MILVVTILIGLASWRWWRLAAIDTITEPIRARLPMDGWFGDLLYCPWCLGFWIALAHTAAIWWFGDYSWSWAEFAAVVMGASAVTGLLKEAEDALRDQ